MSRSSQVFPADEFSLVDQNDHKFSTGKAIQNWVHLLRSVANLLVALATSIYVPYVIGYIMPQLGEFSIQAAYTSFIISCLGILDVILQLLLTRPGTSRLNARVILDMIAAVPFIPMAAYGLGIASVTRGMTLVELLKLLHWVNLGQSATTVKRSVRNFVDRIPVQLRRLSTVMFLTVLWGNLIAAGYFLLSSSPGSWVDDEQLRLNASTNDFDENNEKVILQMVRSSYFLVQTLLTVGFGDNAPTNDSAKLFSTPLCIVGVVVLGYIVANMSSLFVNLNATSSQFMSNMELIQSELSKHKLDKELVGDMKRRLDGTWSTKRGLIEDNMLSNFPQGLSKQIAFYLNERLVAQSLLFDKLSANAITEICKQANEKRLYNPGDVIIDVGSSEPFICVILHGHVQLYELEYNGEVQNSNSTGFVESARLRPGGTIGLLGCFLGLPSSQRAVALDDVELLRISQARLRKVIHEVYPTEEATRVFVSLTDASIENSIASCALAKESQRIASSPMRLDGSLLESVRSKSPALSAATTTYLQATIMFGSGLLLFAEFSMVLSIPLLATFTFHEAKPGPVVFQSMAIVAGITDLIEIIAMVVQSPVFLKWISTKDGDLAIFVRNQIGKHTNLLQKKPSESQFLSKKSSRISKRNSHSSINSERGLTALQAELKRQKHWQTFSTIIFGGFVLMSWISVLCTSTAVGGDSSVPWVMSRLPMFILYMGFFVRSMTNLQSILKLMGIRFASNQILATRLCAALITFIHMASCLACIVLNDNLYPQDFSVNDEDGQIETRPLSAYYVKALYWVLVNITTVGFGDATPSSLWDSMFTIVLMCIGVTTFAGIISFATLLMNSAELSETSVDHRRAVLAHFMLNREIRSKLQQQVMDYFDYIQQRDITVQNQVFGIDEVSGFINDTSDILATEMRSDILYAMLSSTIQSSMLFCNKSFATFKGPEHESPNSELFIRAIIGLLQHQVFEPGDIIYSAKYKEHGRCLAKILFFTHGEAEIFEDGGIRLGPLKTGNSFGTETFFKLDTPLGQYVEIITRSEGWFLYKGDFDSLANEFPAAVEHCNTTLANIGATSLFRMRSVRSKRGPKGKGDATDASRSTFILLNWLGRVYGPKSLIQKFFYHLGAIGVIIYLVCLPVMLAILKPNLRYIEYESFSSMIAFVDVFFFLDYISRTFFFVDNDTHIYMQTSMYKRKLLVAVSYLGSRNGVLDTLAVIPIDRIALLLNPNATIRYVTLMQLNRLLRTKRLVMYIIRLGSGIQSTKRKAAVLICKLLVFFLLVVHILGCMFFFVAVVQDEQQIEAYKVSLQLASVDKFQPVSWAAKLGLNTTHLFGIAEISGGMSNTTMCNKNGVVTTAFQSTRKGTRIPQYCDELSAYFSRYMVSTYWTVGTMTAVGYGDVVPVTFDEHLFTILVLLVGVMIFSIMISNLEQIVAQSNATSTLFQTRNDQIKRYMAQKKLPDSLRLKVSQYMLKLWVENRGITETKILSYLNPSLRSKIIEAQCPRLVNDFPVLGSHCCNLMRQIVPLVQVELYCEGENVYHFGEHSHSSYYLISGTIKLVSEDGDTVYGTVNSGTSFGTDEFFGGRPYESGACVANDARVIIITRNVVEQVLSKDESIRNQYVAEVTKIGMRRTSGIADTQRNLKNRKVTQLMNVCENAANLSNEAWVILPNSPIRYTWDLIIFIDIVYFAITVTFKVGFLQQFEIQETLDTYAILTIVDWFFWSLLIINAFGKAQKFATVHEGVLIKVPREIGMLYLRRDLLKDIVTLCPLDPIVTMASNPWYGAIAGFVRLWIMRDLGTLSASLNSAVDNMQVYLKSGTRHLAKLVATVCLVCHWVACGRSFVVWYEGNRSPHTTIRSEYITALYYATYTITTVGYGNITVNTNLQKLYSTMVMIIGSFLCDAGLTSTLCSVIESGDIVRSESHRTRSTNKHFLSRRLIPDIVLAEVEEFFEYQDKQLRNLKEDEILSNVLPKVFHAETLGHLAFREEGNVFACPLLANMNSGMLNSVALSLKSTLFMPGEVIFKKGEVLNRLVFVVSGRISVHETYESGLRRRRKTRHRVGSVVSENSNIISGLLLGEEARGNIVAATYIATECTECLVCSEQSLKSIIDTEFTLAGKFRNLKEMLDDPIAYGKFLQFAQNCQAGDDVEFYNEVENYKGCPQGSQKQDRTCTNIVKKFIAQGGTCELTLEHEVRENILNSVEFYPVDIFDKVQCQVLRMLSMDILPRFLKSSEYFELMELLCGSKKGSVLFTNRSSTASVEGDQQSRFGTHMLSSVKRRMSSKSSRKSQTSQSGRHSAAIGTKRVSSKHSLREGEPVSK